MPLIHLTTFIEAPQQRVFDLSRSVKLHKHSMTGYKEEIIDGTISGLMEVNDTVTWKAKHLFKERILKVKITRMQKNDFFIDEMEKGDFKMMKHEHYFKPVENGTIMIDQFHFDVSHSFAGKLIGHYLTRYLSRLLTKRNEVIKMTAEGNQWKQFLNL